jgi:Flp pilus assembly protein TadG
MHDGKIRATQWRGAGGAPTPGRHGAAAVELAILLPVLCFLFVAIVDFARIIYADVILTNCASAGAVYASNPNIQPLSPFYNVNPSIGAQNAALAEASNLSPAPSVSVVYGSSSGGPFNSSGPLIPGYCQVTVTWTFQTIVDYQGLAGWMSGIPPSTTLTRVVVMEMVPPS